TMLIVPPTAAVTFNPAQLTPAGTLVVGGVQGSNANTGANTTANTTTNNTGSVAGTCTPPTGWVAYMVQTGDSVNLLAQRYGIDATQLVSSNCLANADVIQVGQTIYLPANTQTGNTGAPSNASNNSNAVTNSAGAVSIQNFWVEPATVQNDGQYQ